MNMSEEVKKKIEQAANLRLLQGKSSERAFWTGGAEFGVSLMQEEVEKPLTDDERKELKILRGYKNNPTRWMSQEEKNRLTLLVKKEWGAIHPTIESQAKEIQRLKEMGFLIETEKDKEISQLKEALSDVRDRITFPNPSPRTKSLCDKIDNLLNDKK